MEQLSIQLRERTKIAHQALEKIMVGKLKGMQQVDDYAYILAVFYSFFHALERQIDPIMSSIVPDYPERRKAAALKNDLAHLGMDLIKEEPAIPVISTVAHGWGAMYVMEGSTLGGKIISKMVQQMLPIDKNSLSFFEGYGEGSAKKWSDFKAQMDAFPSEEKDADDVIRTANETFVKFKSWMEQTDQNAI